jgi:uncharacterized membrane protein YhhN
VNIILCVLAVVAAAYLVSLFFKQGIFQAVGKSCLLPLILAVYIAGSNRIVIPVVMALVFGWIGDLLLLKIQDTRFFRLGLISFLLGHVCYIPTMLYFAGGLNIPVLGISLIIAAALGIFIRRLVRPNKEMKIPSLVYETVILLMAVSALQFFIGQGFPSGALIFAGSLCFLISDSLLAFITFRTPSVFMYFLVMVTYIAAQLCIVLGFTGV